MNEEKVKLKTIATLKERQRLYITVEYDNKEIPIPIFSFQDELIRNKPETLDCIIKREHGGYRITQDLAPVVQQRYQKGQVYPFRVQLQKGNNYLVVDKDDISALLVNYNNKKLYKGQNIKARVLKTQRHRIYLALIDRDREYDGVRYKTLDNLFYEHAISEKGKNKITALLESPEYDYIQNLYNERDGLWLIEIVKKLENSLHNNASNIEQYLVLTRKLCYYIIEGSDALKDLQESERKEKIEELSQIINKLYIYQTVDNIVKEQTEKKYINEQLKCLSKSGYLYQPENKLFIMTCILNSNNSLMVEMMDDFFDIFINGKKEHWNADPFRTAFVNMLDEFVNKHRDSAIHSIGTNLIQKICKATAILLLLSNPSDDIDKRLHRSVFYRMLSYTGKNPSFELLTESFNCLFHPFDQKLEFDWDDIQSLEILQLKVTDKLQEKTSKASLQSQLFRGAGYEIHVGDQGITMLPTGEKYKDLNSILPDDLIEWQNFRILGNFKPKEKVTSHTKEIVKHNNLWKEIEFNLNPNNQEKPQRIKVDPDKGEQVMLRVIDTSENLKHLYCEIDDDFYKGHGWMTIDNTCKYLNDSEDNLHYFLDDQENSYLLPATVVHGLDKDGELEFSLLPSITEYFNNEYNIGDSINCVIKSDTYNVQEKSRYFLAVSEEGASCRIMNNDGALSFQVGDHIKAKIISRNNLSQVICEFEDYSKNYFSSSEAFKNLVENLSYQEDIELEIVPQEITPTVYVKEIVGILDRLAVLQTEKKKSFAFLAIATLICKMIDDHEGEEYYNKRKQLIQMFYEYEESKLVDDEKLAKIMEGTNKNLMETDYIINESITKFVILNSLKTSSNDISKLLQIREETFNKDVRDAVDLAISAVLTSRFNMQNVLTQIKDQIYNLLGVHAVIAERKSYGRETQEIEFKTSLVFPAGNHMKADKALQMGEILKVICGFCNSNNGGTLYLGVNDLGIATGLENDFKELSCDEDYYARYLRRTVSQELGVIANQAINNHWESDEGYRIFVVKVEPTQELVRYKGNVWIRQDTEKRRLSEDKVEEFDSIHQRAYQKYLKNHPIEEKTNNIESQLVEETNISTSQEAPTCYYDINTSVWRNNGQHEWEPGYQEGTQAYLHLLAGDKYKLTAEGIYDEVHLSLAIHDDETDGYIAIGYESGNILIVSIEDLLKRQFDNIYPRNRKEKPFFMCPLKKDDGLVTVRKSKIGELHMRIDKIEELIELKHDGDMSDSGRESIDTNYQKLCLCEIVKNEDIRKYFGKFTKCKHSIGPKVSRNDGKTILDVLKVDLTKFLK